MENTAKTLLGMKVPELKAKCKELKVPNFSKLSKADLIAKLMEASGTSTIIDLTTKLQSKKPPTAPNSIAGANVINAADAANAAAPIDTASKEGKADKVPSKRKSSDEATIKKKAKTKLQAPTSKIASRANTPTPNTGLTLIPPTLTRPDAPPPPPARTVRPVASRPKSTVTKPIPKPISSLLDTSTLPKQPIGTEVTAGVSKPKHKSRPSALQQVKARPRFQGLTQTKAPQLAPRLPDIPVFPQPQLDSQADKIKYIETHFLNSLFILLHKYRAKTITGPQFPCPPSFLKSATYKSSAHLAFQGLYPEIYAKAGPEGFMVAIRFWLARLHSYMQLGSGEAWSSNAKEMGILGPDLATWSPVLSVAEVTEEIWAVTTEEEGEERVTYLVIGEVGEVVASSKSGGDNEAEQGEMMHGCRVRGDWAKYISTPTEKRKKLGSMVKTKDSYSFPNGISSAWSAGPDRAEHLGKVAHRAVMASCALNSFSGEKLSSLAMDAAYLGRPATGGNVLDDLDLYLPEYCRSICLQTYIPHWRSCIAHLDTRSLCWPRRVRS